MVFQLGVMLAASIWSLIIPSIDMEIEKGRIGWIPASIGIIIGVLFLVISDVIVEKKLNNKNYNEQSKKAKMLNLAITLHNIPEGMAVGIAIATGLKVNTEASIMSAIMIAVGIAIQNFPEGMAIALPLKSEGISKLKSFLTGVFSRSGRINFCFVYNFY